MSLPRRGCRRELRLALALLAWALLLATSLETARDRAAAATTVRQHRLHELRCFLAAPANWPALADGGCEVAFAGGFAGQPLAWRQAEHGPQLWFGQHSPVPQ